MLTWNMLLNWILLIVSIYLAVYYILIFLEKRERKSEREEEPEVTIAVPAYNEEKNIEKTLLSILNLDYPKEKIKVIVVDDGSSDKTSEVVENFARKHGELKIKLIRHEKNKGKAAALNTALKNTNTEYFITMDADSFADKRALREVLKKAKNNAVVTACVLPERATNFAEKLQEIEYLLSNYLAFILSKFDAQVVAPGPFSIYKTKALLDIGGFDEKAPAEDLEVVFRLRKKGYSIDFSPGAKVYTEIPQTFKGLIKQRRRWKLGTLDAIEKHREYIIPRDVFSEQVFLTVIFSIAILLLFFLILWSTYKKLDRIYRFLKAVGLDILPFIKNLELSFNIYYLDPQTLLYSFMGVVLTILVLFATFSFFEKKEMGLRDALLYIFIYPGALIMSYLLAFKDWVRREYRW